MQGHANPTDAITVEIQFNDARAQGEYVEVALKCGTKFKPLMTEAAHPVRATRRTSVTRTAAAR